MVGYYKNAPKDEGWLGKEITKLLSELTLKVMTGAGNSTNYVDQILALMREGGWVSPAYLKDALSREMASGFRLGLNKSKGGF